MVYKSGGFREFVVAQQVLPYNSTYLRFATMKDLLILALPFLAAAGSIPASGLNPVKATGMRYCYLSFSPVNLTNL